MRHLAIAFLAACGAKPPAPPTQPPSLAALTWLEGTWHGPTADVRWQTVATALWGVALDDHGFQIHLFDDSDDDGKPMPVALIEMDGTTEHHLAFQAARGTTIEVADPTAGAIKVGRAGDALQVVFSAPGKPEVTFAAAAAAPAKAQALEDADIQFAKDTAAHGADGWAPWFAADGMMWRRGAAVEGTQAIHDAIAKTFAKGALVWTPVASGMRGDWGYTLGTWVFGANVDHGSYCTVWHKEAAGWKIVFDTGRSANP